MASSEWDFGSFVAGVLLSVFLLGLGMAWGRLAPPRYAREALEKGVIETVNTARESGERN